MADVRITINTSALTRLGSQFRRAVAEFPEELNRSQRVIATRSENAFASAARRHGYVKVAEGIRAVTAGNRTLIEVSALDPESGYDYALVTRLGHRVERITAREKKVLKFSYHGKILYRRSVKAWSPTVDWADEAIPEIEGIVNVEAADLANRLVRKLQ